VYVTRVESSLFPDQMVKSVLMEEDTAASHKIHVFLVFTAGKYGGENIAKNKFMEVLFWPSLH
jgi:hypothetical protein